MQSIRDTDKYLPFQSSNRVTINHLARELGLAKGTVSKALNKYSDISDYTKRRVLKKAQEMDYRPLAHEPKDDNPFLELFLGHDV